MRCFFLKETILKHTIPLKKFHTFMLNYNESFEPSNIKNKYIILFKENNVFLLFFSLFQLWRSNLLMVLFIRTLENPILM